MPKLVPPILSRISPRLQRVLACALPLCALSLAVQQLALAQRPSNALPPPGGPAPTDEFYRGEAAYPTATPAATPIATATPRAEGTPQNYDSYPYAAGTPTAQPVPSLEDGSLEAFLGSEPSSLKLSQARAGWRSMRIVRGADLSSSSSSSSSSGAASQSGAPDARESVTWSGVVERFAGAPNVFLTRGRTLRLNGDDHLLVYQAQFPGAAETDRWMKSQLRAGSGQQPSLSTVTRAIRAFLSGVPLRASLINTRQVSAMESIEPFDFQTRFSALSRDLERSFRQFQSRPAAPNAGTPNTGTSDGQGSGSMITPPARIPKRTPTPSAPSMVEPPRVVPVPDAVAQAASTEPLRRLFAAVQRYRADNADVLPPMEDLAATQAALSIYLSGGESWRDPVSGRFFLPNARLSQRRMVHLKPFAQSLILFYSEPDASGQRTVLRLDGIIRRVSAGEWDKLNGTSGVS